MGVGVVDAYVLPYGPGCAGGQGSVVFKSSLEDLPDCQAPHIEPSHATEHDVRPAQRPCT